MTIRSYKNFIINGGSTLVEYDPGDEVVYIRSEGEEVALDLEELKDVAEALKLMHDDIASYDQSE